jgi:hypothetical protein
MEQAQDAMSARTALRNARTRTSALNLRSTRPGRPQRLNREAVEVVSYCAEDVEPLRRRLQRALELLPYRDSA